MFKNMQSIEKKVHDDNGDLNPHRDENKTLLIKKQGVNLQADVNNCEKNPNHEKFIPIKDFKLDNLPEERRDNDLLDHIKAAADLTVIIGVERAHESENSTGTGRISEVLVYPFNGDSDESDVDGFQGNISTNEKRNSASNKIEEITDEINFEECYNEFDDDDDEDDEADRIANGGFYEDDTMEHCKCDQCKISNTPSLEWWVIAVETAGHVVVSETRVSMRLYYDDPNDERVIIISNGKINNKHPQKDWTMLSFVTCDKKLGKELIAKMKTYNDTLSVVKNKYFMSKDEDRLAIIISHPHGCSKMVSLGIWHYNMKEEEDCKLHYEIQTCPGSSGATIIRVGYSGGYGQPLHSKRANTVFNHSSIGFRH